MIPLMSLMIGAYIITKMIVLYARDDPKDSEKYTFGEVFIKIFSIGTLIITVYCVYSIMVAGVKIPSF